MSKLAPELPGARVLDLFAGSGALGLEALSRGAEHVTFVERHRAALEALRKNVRALDVEDRVTIHRGDALQFVEAVTAGRYDVAFADPPYASGDAEQLATRYLRHPFARILGIEHRQDLRLAGDETRRYGNVGLTFFYRL